MNSAERLAGLEHQKEQAKKAIELRDKALRLAENRDFREIILDGFCKEDCARYAQESSDPALGDRERADALAMAQASGHLRRYLSIIVRMATNFENSMEDLEAEIELARAEADGVDLEENEGSV